MLGRPVHALSRLRMLEVRPPAAARPPPPPTPPPFNSLCAQPSRTERFPQHDAERPHVCRLSENLGPARLNSPKVGGPKKYYVYVKDGDKIKKITWGDTTGLKVKINNKKAADSFAARHDCKNKTDKTTAGYWACRLPHYAKQLGLSGGGDFFW